MMKLALFSSRDFHRGAPRVKEAAWLFLLGTLIESWLPGSGWRCWLLRRFGAKIGDRVTIKPHVRVKFPWRLEIADDVWIGEAVWIDNLGTVTIGHDVCISQGAYLCTGSHDWEKPTFDLIVRPIEISSHAWIGAMARLAPGTRVGEGTIVGMGVLVSGELAPYQVLTNGKDGILRVKQRRMDASSGYRA
jgi:putative colanic acid biosynthesis acetyltransferase WcaF